MLNLGVLAYRQTLSVVAVLTHVLHLAAAGTKHRQDGAITALAPKRVELFTCVRVAKPCSLTRNVLVMLGLKV